MKTSGRGRGEKKPGFLTHSYPNIHILDLKKIGNNQEYDKNMKQVQINDTYYKICHDLIHPVLSFWHVGYISINTDFISWLTYY